MSNQGPSLYQRARQEGQTIENEASRLAQRVLQEWTHSGATENKALVDGLQRAFLEEANHALRQVLFQIGARIELTLVKSRGKGGEGGIDAQTAKSLTEALARATKIVDVYLDRGRVAQLALTLHPEPFSLDKDIEDILRWNGFLDEPTNLDMELSLAPVIADRERLRDVFGHLLARFWFSRTGDEKLVVHVRPGEDGGVQGFIGVSRSHLKAEDLIEEINNPLSLEAIEIDIPYIRSVLQRHGGNLYVASQENNTIGFGFKLPPEPHDTNKEEQHFE